MLIVVCARGVDSCAIMLIRSRRLVLFVPMFVCELYSNSRSQKVAEFNFLFFVFEHGHITSDPHSLNDLPSRNWAMPVPKIELPCH